MSFHARACSVVTGAMAGVLVLAAPAMAQERVVARDSAPHFGLFTAAPVLRGFSLGGSGDIRVRHIPVPLRLSVAFSNSNDVSSSYESSGASFYGYRSGARLATASAELVMRPLPKLFHVQPYILSGVGVGTLAERRGSFGYALDGEQRDYFSFTPRQTAAFFTTGLGLDVGRMFVEVKGAVPIATNSTLGNNAVNVGFRFWD